ncbi:MAG: MiaB/RimO family radical SAM methylthiotransferase, partial [Kutzneria sp.]|nr:MiaB/RimO family radical SAM methylthiotransferase [Kutzneria sp.]
ERDGGETEAVGRGAHQAPETDGQTRLVSTDGLAGLQPGRIVTAKVVATEGVDLVAEPLEPLGCCEDEEAGG